MSAFRMKNKPTPAKQRPWFRKASYAQALAKWESGEFESKAALARHLGIERGGMARLLRVALAEREAGLKLEMSRNENSNEIVTTKGME